MAYKVFSNGDALTGGELNTFLMNQSVISFATTTARDAALPSPLEGQLVWLEDSNKYVYYTGSAWTDLLVPASSGNAIINGAFDIWQRGTSFTNPAGGAYTVDRWQTIMDGTGATRTVSQQTFTPGTAPVAGYEGQFFLRSAKTVAGSGQTFNVLTHKIEDVRQFAGQTAVLSFFAKADSARNVTSTLTQNFGSGGSGSVQAGTQVNALTTSWQRFTQVINFPSISGKTVGTSSQLVLDLSLPINTTETIDIWGVQLETGSTATAFKRNGANIADELSSCQRYYWRAQFTGVNTTQIGSAIGFSSTRVFGNLQLPTSMRVLPSIARGGTTVGMSDTNSSNQILSISIFNAPTNLSSVTVDTSHSSGITQFRPYMYALNTSGDFIELSAEL